MNTPLHWQQPPVVWEWEKQELWAGCRYFGFFVAKVAWPLWAVLLSFAYYWRPLIDTPAQFWSWFRSIALVGLFCPFFLVLMLYGPYLTKFFYKKGRRYEVNADGIFHRHWLEPVSVRWKQIDVYRFIDHPEVPGIRVLQFKVKPTKFGPIPQQGIWCGFEFDPEITSESEIDAVFRHQLGESSPL